MVIARLHAHAPEIIHDNGQWYITTCGWRGYNTPVEGGVAIAETCRSSSVLLCILTAWAKRVQYASKWDDLPACGELSRGIRVSEVDINACDWAKHVWIQVSVYE